MLGSAAVRSLGHASRLVSCTTAPVASISFTWKSVYLPTHRSL